MRQAVEVYRSGDHCIVESTSMVVRGSRVANGWAKSTPADDPEQVGRMVRAGLERSGVMEREQLPAFAPGTTPASEAAGFASEDAMMAAGTSSAAVGLRDGRWKVTPVVNMGPGQAWTGHADAPEVFHEGEWSDEELGAVVLRALDDAERVSPVQPGPSAHPTSAAVQEVAADDGGIRYVSVTGHEGRFAVEALSPSGPEELPTGWVRVLEAGVGDVDLGQAVLAGLAEAGAPLPAGRVHPAAETLGAADDEALAVPGAARVLVEGSVPGTLYVMGLENLGPEEGFGDREDPDQREVLDVSPQVVGMSVRLALEDAAG